MRAVWFRFRAELRPQGRAWLGLALLGGLAGAVVLAAFAGARRTDSAYARFLKASNASDVLLFDDTEQSPGTPIAPVPDPARLERLPGVVEAAGLQFVSYVLGSQGFVVPRDGRAGNSVDRLEILAGRRADPRRADEVVVGFALADKRRLHVGDTFPLIPPGYVAAAKRRHQTLPFPQVILRIVGIEASPGEFPPQPPGLHPLVHGTPAFYRRYERFLDTSRPSALVRLRDGEQGVPRFLSAVQRISGKRALTFHQTQAQLAVPVRRSFHLQAVALWILGGLVAVTAALVLSQLLARQAFVDATEAPMLRALGMTRRQLFGLGMARAAAVALPAAFLAIAAAIALSPLAPIGEARTAEPHPGLRVDAVVLALGGLGVALVTVVLAGIPARRTARLAGSPLGTVEAGSAVRPSAVIRALSRLGAPPPLSAGARLALEPGHGRTALPVRATIAGLVLAIAALSASLVVGASLDNLLSTPRLYGWNWDLEVTNYGYKGVDLNRRKAKLAAIPGIAELSIGGDGQLDVGGTGNVPMLGVDGPVAPPVAEGRRPAAADEIALAQKTMQAAGAGIGSSVAVRALGLPAGRMRVVGRVVIPPAQTGRLGEGALVTQSGLLELAHHSLGAGGTDVFVRLAPAANRRAVVESLRRVVGDGFAVVENTKPTDVVNFGRVQKLPLILAGILAVLAAATLVHTLVSAVRRRRRDLALLKTIGFVREQLVAVVLWQATIIAAVAVLFGVPLGVALGRWAWGLVADGADVVRETVLPAWQIAVAVAATVLLANLVAALPGRSAARTRPMEVLRAE